MISGKKVMITGATSGLGKLTAKLLIARGAFPILTGRNEQKLLETVAELKGAFAYYVMNVDDYGQVLQVVQRIEDEHGGIDILLNNAGFGRFESISEASIQSYEEMMNTNYMGTVRCTKAVLPYFLKRGQGHIINVASMAGKIGSPKSTGYTATKHAVLGFTNALRMELADSGIYVSAVNPGPIDTPFFTSADPSGSYVNNIRWFMMTPEKVVHSILKVMQRRTAEVNLPLLASAGIKLYQLFPRLSDRLAAGLLNKK